MGEQSSLGHVMKRRPKVKQDPSQGPRSDLRIKLWEGEWRLQVSRGRRLPQRVAVEGEWLTLEDGGWRAVDARVNEVQVGRR